MNIDIADVIPKKHAFLWDGLIIANHPVFFAQSQHHKPGLMIMAGIDANEDVESQNYVFTSFGKMVDQYALSFEDDERFKWHKKAQKSEMLFDNGMEEYSNEEIQDMFNKVMKEGET